MTLADMLRIKDFEKDWAHSSVMPSNPYENGSNKFWAWEGWGAAMKLIHKESELAARLSPVPDTWLWQGDGTDHPQSMSGDMKIVITGAQLRALMEQVKAGN